MFLNILTYFKHIKENTKFLCHRVLALFVTNFLIIYVVFTWQDQTKNIIPEIPQLSCSNTEAEMENLNVNFFSNIFDYPEDEMTKIYSSLNPGGQRKVSTKKQYTAIIVPYRDRALHLFAFLRHLHYFLRNQQINYGIFVVEQKQNQTFNRGKLMNIGFLEALKNGPWNCFIFHDVDLLPENPLNIYNCKKNPTHFSSAIDKFNYSIAYDEYFGGVNAMFRSHFEKLNGFSNEFWGWGGEDDEVFLRIKAHKQKYYRLSKDIGRYKMFRHVRDKGNEIFKCRFVRINETYNRFHFDGLNSIKYLMLQKQKKYLYTHFLVDLLEEESTQFTC